MGVYTKLRMIKYTNHTDTIETTPYDSLVMNHMEL